jgi:hypothetical protein
VNDVRAAFVCSPENKKDSSPIIKHPQSMVNKILQSRLRFENSKYDILQHVPYYEKRFDTYFAADNFFSFVMNCLHPKLFLVTKPVFVFAGVLTDVTLELVGAKVCVQLLKVQRTVPVLYTKKSVGPFLGGQPG